MEDAFGDPSTPVAKRSLDFHHPLPHQLDKIMHEIKGGIYHEDSGTHSDMDSLSSETDVKMMKAEDTDRESHQMAGDFSIEVGGFAITCESDGKMNAKKSDYMYEIGTKYDHDEHSNETNLVEPDTSGKHAENKVQTSEDTNVTQEAVSLPPPVPVAQPTARPRSAPTFSSLQQRRSSRIQLKSFSTTALPSQLPTATINHEKILADYKSASMNDEFPKWLYSEVVKVGLYSKPSFLHSNSSSGLSSSCSDAESNMDDNSTATDSSTEQQVEMQVETTADSGTPHTTTASTTQDNARDIDQFNHYEAICYLWRGMWVILKYFILTNHVHYRMEGHIEKLLV